MKRIIIDTNALMSMKQFNIDLTEALKECCDFSFTINVLEGSIKELQNIQQQQQGKNKEAANLALQIIKAKDINIINHPPAPVDDILTELSKKSDLILTQDRELKKRLQKPYLSIRQRKKIIIIT